MALPSLFLEIAGLDTDWRPLFLFGIYLGLRDEFCLFEDWKKAEKKNFLTILICHDNIKHRNICTTIAYGQLGLKVNLEIFSPLCEAHSIR